MKSLKPLASSSTIVSGAFKQKNVYISKDEPSEKQKTKVTEIYEDEESIINVTSEEKAIDISEASSSFR